MTTLAAPLRTLLENTVKQARTEAAKAAYAALTALAVDREEPFASMDDENRSLRRLLREKERQLGDFEALVQAVAYEQWHRMLFARFLAENGLLMHPEYGVSVSLAECAELAEEEGEPDGWMVAAKYAATMLPGIFRIDDPLHRIRLAAEGRQALETELANLPPAVFTSDDGLGWVYQFWQSEKKKELNTSRKKIGGADIPPVTQLFTEPYMVEFLLHNTLGAWWASRYPDDDLIETFTYLRTDEEGKPIAGTYPGWPGRAADLRVLDPCCGSGHFLVAAFGMLRAMRMREEGLGAAEAGNAVLRDNLFGLEIDPRCTEIAAFALAVAAWKEGGYRKDLPVPNVACSGIPVGERLYHWTHLADGNQTLEASLRTLYETFQKAPDLGSLIDPEKETVGPIFAQALHGLPQRLVQALTHERTADDPAMAVFGEAAAGAARAGSLLMRHDFHVVITNPPYIGRGIQAANLKEYLATRYPDGKGDTATAFLDRCRAFCASGGTCAMVMPQNWLFLNGYRKLRERLLKEQEWNAVVRLGEGGFKSSFLAEGRQALIVLTNTHPAPDHRMASLDGSAPTATERATLIREVDLSIVPQAVQLQNPDSIITSETIEQKSLLERFASSLQGLSPADFPRYRRCFWELSPGTHGEWRYWQSTSDTTTPYSGREHILWWSDGFEAALKRGSAFLRGEAAWGKRGVVVSAMSDLPATLYTGELFDNNVAVIVPRDQSHILPIWVYCSSPEFGKAVRRLNQKVGVANATIGKVSFDLDYWQRVAAEQYPDGLPEPFSNDPTQWLFKGHPVGSPDPLQVAVARLLGYHWPEEDEDDLDRFADADGIVCLPAVRGEPPASERLRSLLAAAYGDAWSFALQEELLTDVKSGGKGLDDWLRDGFWTQHCARFHNRPFIWHIWDGRKDGFSALVNYHALDRQKLERLTYTYLNDWLARQRAGIEAKEPGAEGRLLAAQQLQGKLQAILDGEPPYDIYVRWKPLAKQPIGWEPDLNDGVRLNIRPFVEAGVLRGKFTINWNKDRGTDPPSAPNGPERINDRHLTRAEKEAARRAATAGARP